ncbi:MAG TPA: hypothetical protein VGN22_18700 [Pseudonocardia sp.]|jgi:hypothetical protein
MSPARRYGFGFWAVAAVFLTVIAFSTAPGPLYTLYRERDGFSALAVTIIYAAYAVGAVVGLVRAGHLFRLARPTACARAGAAPRDRGTRLPVLARPARADRRPVPDRTRDRPTCSTRYRPPPWPSRVAGDLGEGAPAPRPSVLLVFAPPF